MTEVDTSAPTDYLSLRERTINQNNEVLRSLGLDNGSLNKISKRKANNKRKKSDVEEEEPTRRSSRATQKPTDYSENALASEDMEMDDSDNSSGLEYDEADEWTDSDSDDDDEETVDYEKIPPPKRRKSDTDDLSSGQCEKKPKKDLISVEKAKTGRSTCRSCREPIEKGADRVGMEAWIMGRNGITWQCIGCFLENIMLELETTGKSKCKFSGQKFDKGEIKIGLRSHTATKFVNLDSAPFILRPVFEMYAESNKSKDVSQVAFDSVIGKEELNDEQLKTVQNTFEKALTAEAPKAKTSETTERENPKANVDTTSSTSSSKEKRQVPLGEITKTKGKVCWLFANNRCYGKLVPSKETKKFCYAITHKGNTKALAKDKSYWWLLDQCETEEQEEQEKNDKNDKKDDKNKRNAKDETNDKKGKQGKQAIKKEETDSEGEDEDEEKSEKRKKINKEKKALKKEETDSENEEEDEDEEQGDLPTRCKKTNCLIFSDFPKFRPNLAPFEILQQGAFGGTYFRPIKSGVTGESYKDAWKEFPSEWFKGMDTKKQLTLAWKNYDKTVNKFGVKCGGDLDMWESKGWINEQDPYGWFQWYCRFYLGRRTDDDQRQISRAIGVMGDTGRFRNNLIGKISRGGTTVDDETISPVIRQSLHHWGYCLTLKDANKYCKLKKLAKIKS